ncbi:MAG: diacylglycerol kinase family protein [Rhodothermales bacterium]
MSGAGELVLINPISGGGHDAALSRRLREFAESKDAAIVFTTPEMDYTRLGLDAYHRIWICGGDGSVGNVINGIHRSASARIPLIGLVPVGTGNDFAHALGYSSLHPVPDPGDVFDTLLSDYVVVQMTDEQGGRFERAMINSAGIGLDAEVAALAGRMRIFGRSSYFAATIARVLRRPHWSVTIETDGGTATRQAMLVGFGNSPRTGGGFLLTPEAEIDDGFVDICTIDKVRVARALILLPTVRSGRHIRFAEVTTDTARTVTVEVTPPAPIHVDGEVISLRATRVEATVRAQCLPFCVPTRRYYASFKPSSFS